MGGCEGVDTTTERLGMKKKITILRSDGGGWYKLPLSMYDIYHGLSLAADVRFQSADTN